MCSLSQKLCICTGVTDISPLPILYHHQPDLSLVQSLPFQNWFWVNCKALPHPFALHIHPATNRASSAAVQLLFFVFLTSPVLSLQIGYWQQRQNGTNRALPLTWVSHRGHTDVSPDREDQLIFQLSFLLSERLLKWPILFLGRDICNFQDTAGFFFLFFPPNF